MLLDNENSEKEKPVCFVIMPISDVHGYDTGHFGRVYEFLLKPAIIKAGFQPIRADDAVKTDYIVISIIKRIIDSEMVLCDLSGRNPNVMYELGVRHAFNKPVVLVKDNRTEKVFDIQGLRYHEYDPTLRIDSVQKDGTRILGALEETKSLGGEDINSIVQLASIRIADLPLNQTISADTKLLFDAITVLQKQIEAIDRPPKKSQTFFHIDEDSVVFTDNTRARIGEEVYDSDLRIIGTIIDIHPSEEKIFLRNSVGKVTPYVSFSVKSKGLNNGEIPF